MIDEMDAKLVSMLGDRYSAATSETLEQVVVETLIERRLTLAIAESCTGGLIANQNYGCAGMLGDVSCWASSATATRQRESSWAFPSS